MRIRIGGTDPTPARRHLFASAALIAAAVSVLAFLLSGCGKKPRPAPEQAPVAIAVPGAEQEHWRRLYDERRPDAPERYQVFPKQPRDNRFGEFDDSRQQGLDRQPELPPLPTDRAPAIPAPPDPRPSGFAPAVPVRAGSNQAPVRQAPANVAAGMTTHERFYPLEQLVYGGDYPELDKPELYRLMPRDIVTVTVKDHPEFCGQLEIQADGTVHIANTPDLVRIRGLTAEEAASAIRLALAKYVKGECLVRVQANRARGGYYMVFGDVLQPGRFPMGMEPVRLSEALLAANWEANPARRDMDGDELGPSFPAASPRGRYVAPASADLARVMLITPHRSQPSRTVHDVRSAMMGVQSEDPLVRPGQIIVVPSVVPERNRALGVEPPEALAPGKGFAGSGTPARLPDVQPASSANADAPDSRGPSRPWVEASMEEAYQVNRNVPVTTVDQSIAAQEPSYYMEMPGGERRIRTRGWDKGF